MKTIIATTIALTIATSASAAYFPKSTGTTWGGPSNTVHGDQCAFSDNTPGVMSFTANNKTWNVSSPATVKIRHKGAGNIKVTTTQELFHEDDLTTKVADVKVDYRSNTGISFNNNNQNVNDNNASWEVPNKNKLYRNTTVTIGGKATMVEAEMDKIDDNENYVIKHTVTCLQ
jgi:hypothetical protein